MRDVHLWVVQGSMVLNAGLYCVGDWWRRRRRRPRLAKCRELPRSLMRRAIEARSQKTVWFGMVTRFIMPKFWRLRRPWPPLASRALMVMIYGFRLSLVRCALVLSRMPDCGGSILPRMMKRQGRLNRVSDFLTIHPAITGQRFMAVLVRLTPAPCFRRFLPNAARSWRYHFGRIRLANQFWQRQHRHCAALFRHHHQAR